jgi:hypothetical protein
VKSKKIIAYATFLLVNATGVANAQPVDLVSNGGFYGDMSWSTAADGGAGVAATFVGPFNTGHFLIDSPRLTTGFAFFNNASGAPVSYFRQTINVPESGSYTLTFDYKIESIL